MADWSYYWKTGTEKCSQKLAGKMFENHSKAKRNRVERSTWFWNPQLLTANRWSNLKSRPESAREMCYGTPEFDWRSKGFQARRSTHSGGLKFDWSRPVNSDSDWL